MDGRCGEAKYCASRFLYDTLGVNIQLRTFDGKEATLSPHQQPIKCGQCVYKDCPVRARLHTPADGKPAWCLPYRAFLTCSQNWPCLKLPSTRRTH